MTRIECEDKILDLLLEISKVYDEYYPNNDGVGTVIGDNGHVSVFAYEVDENGHTNFKKMVLNAAQYEDGERRHWKL